MIVVPAAIPPTVPLVVPTVPMAVALLLHVPPTPSLSVIVCPTHTAPGPVIAGALLIVMLIGVGALEPQPFVTVIKPLYVPGAADAPTVTGMLPDGSAVPAATSGIPAGVPVQVMP